MLQPAFVAVVRVYTEPVRIALNPGRHFQLHEVVHFSAIFDDCLILRDFMSYKTASVA
jgi:hypothetical protein